MARFFRILLLGLIFAMESCSSEDEVPPTFDCTGVNWSATISPIISNSCAIAGCHVPGTGRQNFLDLATVQANASEIKIRTGNRTMPQTGTLTADQISQIACWVDDGAVDN